MYRTTKFRRVMFSHEFQREFSMETDSIPWAPMGVRGTSHGTSHAPPPRYKFPRDVPRKVPVFFPWHSTLIPAGFPTATHRTLKYQWYLNNLDASRYIWNPSRNLWDMVRNNTRFPWLLRLFTITFDGFTSHPRQDPTQSSGTPRQPRAGRFFNLCLRHLFDTTLDLTCKPGVFFLEILNGTAHLLKHASVCCSPQQGLNSKHQRGLFRGPLDVSTHFND